MAHITITTNTRTRSGIYSSHNMFDNEYLKASYNDGVLRISVPNIDYVGKVYKTSHYTKWNYRSITFCGVPLEKGRYEIDEEESTEDEIVIYLK